MMRLCTRCVTCVPRCASGHGVTSSRQLINCHQAMPEPQISMPASAAPAPGSDALLDSAFDCPVCGESIGRKPALCCAQCTCGHFHPACAMPEVKTSRCPAAQCAQPGFTGAVTPVEVGPRESMVLTWERRAAADEAEAASGASGTDFCHRAEEPHHTQRK